MELFESCLMLYSGFAFISYLSYVIYKFGILNAISASYYELKKLSKSLFTLFIWSISFPITIVGVSETPLMFFAGAFLSFVGAAPHYKQELEGKVHYVGALAGISFGFLALLIVFQQFMLSGIFLVFSLYALLTKMKNYFWWIEILAFITIYIGLLLHKL